MTCARITARALALLLLPTLAAAGQLNLRWNECWGDGGVTNRVFACNTNAGTNPLIASFILPRAVAGVTAVEGFIDYAVAGGSVPEWWMFRIAGTCRSGSLAASASASLLATACANWAADAGTGTAAVVGYTLGFHGPSSARIIVSNAIATPQTVDLVAHQEYFAFTLLINNLKSAGSGACAGCALGACIGLQNIRLETIAPSDIFVLGSLGEGDQLATWQGGGSLTIVNDAGHLICPAATSARSSTWGAVKTLYR